MIELRRAVLRLSPRRNMRKIEETGAVSAGVIVVWLPGSQIAEKFFSRSMTPPRRADSHHCEWP